MFFLAVALRSARSDPSRVFAHDLRRVVVLKSLPQSQGNRVFPSLSIAFPTLHRLSQAGTLIGEVELLCNSVYLSTYRATCTTQMLAISVKCYEQLIKPLQLELFINYGTVRDASDPAQDPRGFPT